MRRLTKQLEGKQQSTSREAEKVTRESLPPAWQLNPNNKKRGDMNETIHMTLAGCVLGRMTMIWGLDESGWSAAMADGSMKRAYVMLILIIPLIKYVLFVNTFLLLCSLVP